MSSSVAALVGGLAGLIAGAGVAWSVMSRRLAQRSSELVHRAAELDAQAQRTAELTAERDAACDEALLQQSTAADLRVEQLVNETSGLRQILRDSKMRGAWGEQHLRNVIEAAGMSRNIDYVEQVTVGEACAAQSMLTTTALPRWNAGFCRRLGASKNWGLSAVVTS